MLIVVFLILSFLEILAERRQNYISVEFNFVTVFAFNLLKPTGHVMHQQV
jgi:hypothetical protein